MAVTLTLIGKRPGQSQYSLDTFTEIYKCDATADVVLTDLSVPAKGSAHPDYPLMFVTDRRVNEAGESASALDLVYMGSLTEIAATGIVASVQDPSNGDVASATTNTDSDIWPAFVTNPATVQFYAITNSVTATCNTKTPTLEADDPPEVSTIISFDLGNGLQGAACLEGIATWILTKAFVQFIIEPPPTIEPIVAGQYYRITKRKTRTLFPYSPPC